MIINISIKPAKIKLMTINHDGKISFKHDVEIIKYIGMEILANKPNIIINIINELLIFFIYFLEFLSVIFIDMR